MKQFLLILLTLLASCGSNTSHDYPTDLEVLCTGDDYKIFGEMSNGLLTDSLFYFRQNRLIFKQYWENGCLLATEYNDNDHFRKLEFVSRLVDTTRHKTYSKYFTDLQDTTFKVFPYDLDITNFYNKIKKHNLVSFKTDELSIIKIINIPQEICTLAVAGGIVKKTNEGYSIIPTKHKGDTLKIFYLLTFKGWPSEYEAFIIE
jgi:hypothetical protein